MFDTKFEDFRARLKNNQPNKKLSFLGRQFFRDDLEILRCLRDMLRHCSDTVEDYPGFEISIENFNEWSRLRSEPFEDLQVRNVFKRLMDFQPGSSEENPYGYTVYCSNHNGLILRFHNPMILEKIVDEIEKQVVWKEEAKAKRQAEKLQKEKQDKKAEQNLLEEKGKADIPNKIKAGLAVAVIVALISFVIGHLTEICNWFVK